MRGNSDRSETYPFSVAPAEGWGKPNPAGEYVIADARQVVKAVKINDEGSFSIVDFPEATRFKDAAEAAIVSGRVANQYRTKLAA